MSPITRYGRWLIIVVMLASATKYLVVRGVEGEVVEKHGEELQVEDMLAETAEETVYDERELMAVKTAYAIDAYLTRIGSPMAGLGHVYVAEAEKVGIDPTLPAAISVIESSGGKACFAPHNAWGLLQYRRGFSSWEEGIRTVCEFLHRHYGAVTEAWQCRGYCVPDRPWMDRVSAVQREMRRLAR